MKYILAFVIWNILVMFVYGLDKKKAELDAWRIPEKTLIGLAAVFGGVGAFLGMHLFHHKTRKPLFKIGVPICIILNVIEIVAVIWMIERQGAVLL